MSTENKEIEKFDANKAMQSVKEKIKDAFVSLIPDSQWDEMVKKELDDYFKVREDNNYNQNRYGSNFTRDVHALLKEEIDSRVKNYLATNFTTVWFHNGIAICDSKIEEMIVKNSGKILTDMIGGSITMAIQNAGYRM